MKRQNIIVIVSPVVETWGNLSKLCDFKKWKYSTLSRKKFPFMHDGHEIHKTEFK